MHLISIRNNPSGLFSPIKIIHKNIPVLNQLKFKTGFFDLDKIFV